MTDKQPEALRLADELDCRGMNRPSWKDQFDAGYELRRLHEENEALRARLAQPEQEPVATVYDAYDTTGIDWHCKDAPATGTKLYTAPPQREWQGLTDEEIHSTNGYEEDRSLYRFARAIEAKLKEKNA